MYFTHTSRLNDGGKSKRSKREEMKYSEQEIPDGDAGIDETVRQMIEMATEDAQHSRIIQLAKTLQRKTDLATVRAIYNHVQDNVRYESDPEDKELLIRPRHVLSRRRPFGDCDDMTMALAALYLASGFHVRMRVIEWKYDDDGNPILAFTHVYPLVYIPSLKGWIPTDAVIEEGGGFGNEQGVVRRRKDYPITQNDIDMATLARLDDRIGFADSSVGGQSQNGQEPCCGKKRKRPIVLNINNSNSNTITAGNTTNTSRTNSPEDFSRSTYQHHNSPRTQSQYAPHTNYSPRPQFQNIERRTDTYAPSGNYPNNGYSRVGSQPSNPAPAPNSRPANTTVPQRTPAPAPQQERYQEPVRRQERPMQAPLVPDNRSYGNNAQPQRETPPQRQNQTAPEQEQPLREPPREFDERVEEIPNVRSASRPAPREFDERVEEIPNVRSASRPAPREFDERVEEIPNVQSANRSAPREFDERVEEIPNVRSASRPAPREFDERVEEIPNVRSASRPAPREFDERRIYAPQASTMRPAPSEFDARQLYAPQASATRSKLPEFA